MFRICVYNSHAMQLKSISSYIYEEMNFKNMSYSIHEYSSLKDINDKLDKQQLNFDLIIMSIDDNEEKCIDTVKRINELSHGSEVIYLAQDINRVKNIFETEFLYFIIIDEFKARFYKALNKMLQGSRNIPKLKIRKKKQTIILKQPDILYLERNLRVTNVVCKNITYTINDKLDDIINQLDPTHFVRCHRSYIVNSLHIQSYNHDSISMYNNYTIPISRRYQNDIKTFLLK